MLTYGARVYPSDMEQPKACIKHDHSQGEDIKSFLEAPDSHGYNQSKDTVDLSNGGFYEDSVNPFDFGTTHDYNQYTHSSGQFISLGFPFPLDSHILSNQTSYGAHHLLANDATPSTDRMMTPPNGFHYTQYNQSAPLYNHRFQPQLNNHVVGASELCSSSANSTTHAHHPSAERQDLVGTGSQGQCLGASHRSSPAPDYFRSKKDPGSPGAECDNIQGDDEVSYRSEDDGDEIFDGIDDGVSAIPGNLLEADFSEKIGKEKTSKEKAIRKKRGKKDEHVNDDPDCEKLMSKQLPYASGRDKTELELKLLNMGRSGDIEQELDHIRSEMRRKSREKASKIMRDTDQLDTFPTDSATQHSLVMKLFFAIKNTETTVDKKGKDGKEAQAVLRIRNGYYSDEDLLIRCYELLVSTSLPSLYLFDL